MIVDSMNDQEITKAVLSEKEYVLRCCSNKYVKQFKDTVLHTNTFPCTQTYKCKTPNSQIEYSISMRAEKRGEHSTPSYSIYVLYRWHGGVYAAQVENDWKSVTIFPPHFFERYRERILKDTTMPIETVIPKFFAKFFGYCDMWLDKNKQQLMEKIFPDEEVDMVGAYHEGMIFGKNHDNYCIARTVISFDEFKENQWPQFNQLFDGLVNLTNPEFVLRYFNSIKSESN